MPHRKRLLLVEDDADLRFAVTKCFVLVGWEVVVACDLREANGFLATSNGTYSAAIIDLFLPDGGGDSLIADIKKIRAAPRVIVYTACGESERIARALALGADCVALKPASFIDTLFPLVKGDV